jgi:Kef-type K+ transport system membrane component KefB
MKHLLKTVLALFALLSLTIVFVYASLKHAEVNAENACKEATLGKSRAEFIAAMAKMEFSKNVRQIGSDLILVTFETPFVEKYSCMATIMSDVIVESVVKNEN